MRVNKHKRHFKQRNKTRDSVKAYLKLTLSHLEATVGFLAFRSGGGYPSFSLNLFDRGFQCKTLEAYFIKKQIKYVSCEFD